MSGKHHTVYDYKLKGSRKRKSHLAAARAIKARKAAERQSADQPTSAERRVDEPSASSTDPVPSTSASPSEPLPSTSFSSEPLPSASRSKLEKFQKRGDNVTPSAAVRIWTLVEIGQLNELFSGVQCPNCLGNGLSVNAGTSLGFSRELTLTCGRCGELNKCFSSPRIEKRQEKNVGFEVNRLAVLYTHEIGGGHASLRSYGKYEYCCK